MKKVIILSFLLAFVASEALAQLSSRENLAFNQPIGNRPQAGDAGLVFVIPIVDLSQNNGSDAGLYAGNILASGDFLTFKYYNTNTLVYRAAIRLTADNGITKGTQADSSEFNSINEDFAIQQRDRKSISREWSLAGGIEQHFTPRNLFDVYVAAEALVGLGKDRTYILDEYFNGDSFERNAVTRTTVFGVQGLVGVNVFIAELPISVGVEYGLSGKFIFGGKTKVTETANFDGGADYDGEWYEHLTDALGDPDGRKYSDLSRRFFNANTNHNVRFVFVVYFSSDTGE